MGEALHKKAYIKLNAHSKRRYGCYADELSDDQFAELFEEVLETKEQLALERRYLTTKNANRRKN